MSKAVATIQGTDGKRTSIYIRRESYDGRWIWRVCSRSGGEWIDHSGPNQSRDAAIDAIAMLWSAGWDLDWIA